MFSWKFTEFSKSYSLASSLNYAFKFKPCSLKAWLIASAHFSYLSSKLILIKKKSWEYRRFVSGINSKRTTEYRKGNQIGTNCNGTIKYIDAVILIQCTGPLNYKNRAEENREEIR